MSKKMWFLLIIIIWGVWYVKIAKHHPFVINLNAPENFWGITYSTKFAEELDLDWKEVYLAMLDDLKVKYIRIPIYWDEIEKTKGQYDFSQFDFIFEEGAKRDVKFIANVGWRLPRWPECHEPLWVKGAEPKEIQKEAMRMIEVVVNRYKDNPSIIEWQLENEPLLNTFGICPRADEDFLKEEIALLKSLDDRPIMISASGELSTWRREVRHSDIFATTMYRVVWNSWFKYFRYPMPGWFYNLKAKWAGADPDEVVISELQTEPWVPNGTLADLPNIEAEKSFGHEQFKANMQTAINSGFSRAYMWGVEWWYWKKLNGDDSYWQYAKTVFTNNNK